jgi:hypothetical protein
MRRFFASLVDRLEAQGASRCGKEEVLHVIISGACASDMMIVRHLVKCVCITYDDTRIKEDDMPERTDWEEKAKGLLRAEMARKGMTYADLAQRLAAIGIDDNERNLRNKVSRGKFTAGFLLQCLSALGCSSLHLD